MEVLKVIYLQREPLDRIKFSRNGNVTAVFSTSLNNIFLVNSIKNDIKVLCHLKFDKTIIDFLIYDEIESESKILSLKAILLIENSPVPSVGNKIEFFTIEMLDYRFNKEFELETDYFYQNLNYGIGDYDFIAAPFLTKQIHLFEIKV